VMEGRESCCKRSSCPERALLQIDDAEHYEQELIRETKEVETIPEAEASEVSEVFESYGLTKEESEPIVAALRQKPKAWVNFMMRFELGLEEPRPGRALRSASTIAGAYASGGLVPLFPYMLLTQMHSAFLLSVGGDSLGVVHIRIHQRTVHRCCAAVGCYPNTYHWSARRRCGVPYRKVDSLELKKLRLRNQARMPARRDFTPNILSRALSAQDTLLSRLPCGRWAERRA
jgi:hypothetical protein